MDTSDTGSGDDGSTGASSGGTSDTSAGGTTATGGTEGTGGTSGGGTTTGASTSDTTSYATTSYTTTSDFTTSDFTTSDITTSDITTSDITTSDITTSETLTTTTMDCTPSGPIYVDPVLGTDDASHGGGPGACAVATIDYALTVATGEIHLANTAFDVTSVITLTDNLSLLCHGAILDGQPAYATWFVTIRIPGDNVTVQECNIVGESNNGYCIDVSGTGVALNANSITACGGSAVRTQANGNTYTGNTIDHNSTHFFFQNSNSAATINDSNFAGSPQYNVACGTGSAINGTNNSATGTKLCDPDCNCPNDFFN
jgi:hypothetical protein